MFFKKVIFFKFIFTFNFCSFDVAGLAKNLALFCVKIFLIHHFIDIILVEVLQF